jgi:hypothetical protein
MLGSLAEADDAVQEAWLRLSRADTDDVANLDSKIIAIDVLADPERLTLLDGVAG